jgi:hypothetical protein
MIENLNFREKWCVNYVWVFCYRRLAQVCLIVMLKDKYYGQI